MLSILDDFRLVFLQFLIAKPANSCMKRLSLPQILFSSLMLGASLSFAPNNANAWDSIQCSVNVTNNTSQTIYQLYILPSSAEASNPNWKINKLNRPLGVGESTDVIVQTTPDAAYWNAYGVFSDNRLYALSRTKEETFADGNFLFVINGSCDKQNYAWQYLWKFEGGSFTGNWNW